MHTHIYTTYKKLLSINKTLSYIILYQMSQNAFLLEKLKVPHLENRRSINLYVRAPLPTALRYVNSVHPPKPYYLRCLSTSIPFVCRSSQKRGLPNKICNNYRAFPAHITSSSWFYTTANILWSFLPSFSLLRKSKVIM
jgi:hypothetical protein